jgi:glycogen operon protein
MGVEGPTEDEKINSMRERQIRNFLATLMLSQGVPMLYGGDEIARSQQGNNNCYCQDNKLTWHDWDLDDSRKRMLDFTGRLIHLRLAHPNLHRRKFFQDREIRKKGQSTFIQDIAWFNADGNQVPDEVWNTTWSRSIAVMLNGQTLQVSDEDGQPIVDDSFFLIVNAAQDGVEFALPRSPSGKPWCLAIDTEDAENPFSETKVDDKIIVGGRCLKLLSDLNTSSR